MSKSIHKRTDDKFVSRNYRKNRIRKKLCGTAERPRMSVCKSDRHFNVQLIDDDTGHTLLSCSTMSKELKGKIKSNIKGAEELGKFVAESALKKDIKKVVFDRNGFLYHGSIKALADSARKAGLSL